MAITSFCLCIISLYFSITEVGMILLSTICVILLGFYIVYDTMIILHGHNELTTDDYIIAAIILYLDIVNVFLHILRIVGEK